MSHAFCFSWHYWYSSMYRLRSHKTGHSFLSNLLTPILILSPHLPDAFTLGRREPRAPTPRRQHQPGGSDVHPRCLRAARPADRQTPSPRSRCARDFQPSPKYPRTCSGDAAASGIYSSEQVL